MVGALIVWFQSPSLRGSGRFKPILAVVRTGHAVFQSPSLRGSGRFALVPPESGSSGLGVSIPFSAGQWSLHGKESESAVGGGQVSIPFIAGQWSLPGRAGVGKAPVRRCFNPLHCGAVVASIYLLVTEASRSMFQSPSLRGSGRFTLTPECAYTP